MQTVYVVRNGKTQAIQAEVKDDIASIPLPYGAYRRIKRPRWHPTLAEAQEAARAASDRAAARARKLLMERGELAPSGNV
jgi:hypothetical protein